MLTTFLLLTAVSLNLASSLFPELAGAYRSDRSASGLGQPIAAWTFGDRFYGKMRPELWPDLVHVYPKVFEVKPAAVRFEPAIEKGSVVSVGGLSDPRVTSGRSDAFLLEPPNADPFIAVDSDANGVIDATERFALQPSPPVGFISVIKLPLKNAFFKTYPMLIHYTRGMRNANLKPSERLINQSVMALAYGDVEIGGVKTLFQYPFEPMLPGISTTEGLFGIDVDGDGKIRDEQFSPESSYAAKTELVFRLGGRYVSTERIDLAKNEIVVRERKPEEYLRQDVEVGTAIKNFQFVDFAGKKRSFSEFKGKYVLLDIWGVWCVDCRDETPYHVEAYKRFRPRGLEILSLNTDENIETAKAYLTSNNITWPQATNDSVRTLIDVTYRIQEYPSTLLIGPDGKVLIVDQKQLRGEALLDSIDRALPK